MMRKSIFVLIALLILITAGCAASRASVSEMAPGKDWVEDAPMESADYSAGDEERLERYSLNGASGGLPAEVESLVIRNAYLTVVVKDPAASTDTFQRMAEELGGFVVNSNVYQSTYGTSQAKTTRASLSIRVPATRLNEALEKIEQEAEEVTNKQVTGEDVTKEYTDLKSKLRNNEAAEQQLLEIMDAATETEDVLSIFEKLRAIREEIEVIKGQMQYYEDSARYSLISIELIPDVLAQPLQIGGWELQGTAKDSFEDLVAALQFLTKTAIRLVICVLPILLLFGVPAYFVIRAIIRKRRQKKAEKAEENQKQE